MLILTLTWLFCIEKKYESFCFELFKVISKFQKFAFWFTVSVFFPKKSSLLNLFLLDFVKEISNALQNVMPKNRPRAVFLFCTFKVEMSPLHYTIVLIFYIFFCLKSHFLPIFTEIWTKFAFNIPLECWFWC